MNPRLCWLYALFDVLLLIFILPQDSFPDSLLCVWKPSINIDIKVGQERSELWAFYKRKWKRRGHNKSYLRDFELVRIESPCWSLSRRRFRTIYSAVRRACSRIVCILMTLGVRGAPFGKPWPSGGGLVRCLAGAPVPPEQEHVFFHNTCSAIPPFHSFDCSVWSLYPRLAYESRPMTFLASPNRLQRPCEVATINIERFGSRLGNLIVR